VDDFTKKALSLISGSGYVKLTPIQLVLLGIKAGLQYAAEQDDFDAAEYSEDGHWDDAAIFELSAGGHREAAQRIEVNK